MICSQLLADHALDILFMALVLCVFAIAGLVYAAIAARRAALGDSLLKACAGSYEVAAMAVTNVADEHNLLIDAVRRDFNKGVR